MPDVRNSTATVAVGCKLPNGLIMEMPEPAKGRQLLPAPIGERHVLKGANACLVQTPFGSVAAGNHRYSINHVPADFARAWFERYKDMECVKRGQVFMMPDEARAIAAAKERENDKQTSTGLESLVDKDRRLPKQVAKSKPEAEAA